MAQELKTKNVFITGGAQGLGKGYMEALLAAGARVVFGDLNPKTGAATETELQEKFGKDKVKFIEIDVTNASKFETAFKDAVSFLGNVDLMVNNAGIMKENYWEKMIELNLTALVRGTMVAQDHMRKDKGGKGGRIINSSSLLGLEDACIVPVYCGTKHAVRSFTVSMSMAPDLKQQGVEFAVLCPGAADTELVAQMDATTTKYWELFDRNALKKATAPVSCIVEGFMKLVHLEEMNGSMLLVTNEEMNFYTMERKLVGNSWPPESAGPTSDAAYMKK